MTDREELIAELRARCWCVICGYDCSKCDEDLPTLCRSERELFKVAADLLEADFAKDTNVGSKWISVEDRLPETDGKNTFAYNVLVYIPKRDGCNQHGVYIGKLKGIKADDGSGNFWGLKTQACDWTVWGFGYFEQPVVTHWMPMPVPPKED